MHKRVVAALSLLVLGLAGAVASKVLQRPTGIALYALTVFLGAFLAAAELVYRRRGLMCSWRF